MVLNILAVMAGGATGALLRYLVVWKIQSPQAGAIPWGTLAVNLSGSLAIGIVAALVIKLDVTQAWRLFLAVGILGGFTTFSTFSFETAALLRQGFYGNALFYVLLSNIGGIVLAAAGYFVVAGVNS